MKTTVGLRVLWSACLCLAALLCAAAPAGAIVGGAATSISTVPWQVGLVAAGDPATAQFCGGSLLDPEDSTPVVRVVTAAHCVVDPVSGLARTPAQLEVLAGRSTLSTYPAAPDDLRRLRVAAISFSPRYDDVSGDRDVAVLTLETAGVPPTVGTPIRLADTTGLGPTARISGWGASAWGPNESDRVYPDTLKRAAVTIHSDTECSGYYDGRFLASTMLCAGDASNDTCFGDSGGPLAVQSGTTWLLVGITSFGLGGCGDPAHPGVYAEVAEAQIHAYLSSNPLPAPTSTSAPYLQGTPRVGQTLTCNPGGWTEPSAFDTQFVKTANGSTLTLTGSGPTPTYTLTAADTGWQVLCLVKATGTGGWGRARSAGSAPVAAAAVSTPTPAPDPPSTTAPPAAKPRDVTAPKGRFTKASCSRKRCVLDVSVTDRGYSVGVKGVVSSVTTSVKRSCRRHGRRTTCTRKVKKTLHAVRRRAGRYRITLVRPRRGTQRFSAIAVDRAGNRQLKAAVRTLRVR